jgi:hypothetical protein
MSRRSRRLISVITSRNYSREKILFHCTAAEHLTISLRSVLAPISCFTLNVSPTSRNNRNSRQTNQIQLAKSRVPVFPSLSNSFLHNSVLHRRYSMRFTTKFQITLDHQYLYAVGTSSVVRKAAECTFSQLGWKAKWDKNGVLNHYPGGWLQRAVSGYTRLSSTPAIGSMPYETDAIKIAHQETNNLSVSLLGISLCLKVWLSDVALQERIRKFYQSLEYEFRKVEIGLIKHNEWSAVVSKHPELRCSPVWGRNAAGSTVAVPAS